MGLLTQLLLRLAIAVLVSLVVGAVFVIGTDRLLALRRDLPDRLRKTWRPIAALVVVLLVNKVAREVGPTISWIIDMNITGTIYSIEGAFVASVQSVATPPLTLYFSVAYVYMYVFLLVFPFLAYLALSDPRPTRELAVAYISNYLLGLVCYVLFISYGPRNLLPELVEPLLYTAYPKTQLLTSQVNANTNVFPSLHSSTSATVALMAWRTRGVYPRWLYIAVPMAASIIVATMYLGIHWATDVVAGLLLAYVSVKLGERYADRAARGDSEDDATGESGPPRESQDSSSTS